MFNLERISHYSHKLNVFGATLLPLSNIFAFSYHQTYVKLCNNHIKGGIEIGDQPGAQRRYIDNEEFLNATKRFLKITQSERLFFKYFKNTNFKINYIRGRNPLQFEGKQKFHRDDTIYKSKLSHLECFFFLSDINLLSGGIEYARNRSNGHPQISPKNICRVIAKRGDLLIMKSQTLHRGTTRFSCKSRWVISFQVQSKKG